MKNTGKKKKGLILLAVWILSFILGGVTYYIAVGRDIDKRLARSEMGIQKIRERTEAGLLSKREIIDKINGFINLYDNCSKNGELDGYRERIRKYE